MVSRNTDTPELPSNTKKAENQASKKVSGIRLIQSRGIV